MENVQTGSVCGKVKFKMNSDVFDCEVKGNTLVMRYPKDQVFTYWYECVSNVA